MTNLCTSGFMRDMFCHLKQIQKIIDFSSSHNFTFLNLFSHIVHRVDDEMEKEKMIMCEVRPPFPLLDRKRKKRKTFVGTRKIFIRKSILHGKLYLSFGSRLTYNPYNSTGKRWWWWRREILPPCKYTFWTQFNWLMKKIIYKLKAISFKTLSLNFNLLSVCKSFFT